MESFKAKVASSSFFMTTFSLRLSRTISQIQSCFLSWSLYPCTFFLTPPHFPEVIILHPFSGISLISSYFVAVTRASLCLVAFLKNCPDSLFRLFLQSLHQYWSILWDSHIFHLCGKACVETLFHRSYWASVV